MAYLPCSLCDSQVEIAEFDLEKTFTSYSKTSLLILLQSCVTETCVFSSYQICRECYFLLDELDNFRLRTKDLEDKLRGYVSKYNSNKYFKSEQIETEKYEECTVCFKKISSNHFKTHLKTHNSQPDELETSFDFDEVNSISEISPLLEDINLLSTEERDDKDKFSIEPCQSNLKKSVTKVKKKNSDNAKPYGCSQCSKTWKTVAELKNHMSSHSDERPYICEICGQAYKRQQALTIHVGMHKGINPYTCIYCNKSFTQKGALVRHTPIHTGELPFQCDLCGKRFVHHTSFNMHKLSHTGEKSYKCELCGLMLMSGSHLKRHMRVHTGEKKFSCNTCGKKFAEKYNLAVHEKLHLGVSKKKKHQCQICDNLYNGQVKLEEHLLNVHQKVQFPNSHEQVSYNQENILV